MRYLPGLLLWGVLFGACGTSGSEPSERALLVVVESSLYEALQPSLEQYTDTMALERFVIRVESWAPGEVDELKALIFEQVDLNGIEGALLIGELPTAWYEQEAFGVVEDFPMDIYLQDRDAIWVDQNNDGLYDWHTDLELDIYTARLNGTTKRLQDYFERAIRYRREGSLVDSSAFIFFDDDWSWVDLSDAARLNELYSRVDIIQDVMDSNLDDYLEKLTGDGAEFVYQWVHAAPKHMHFAERVNGGEPYITRLSAAEVIEYNLKASFVNMCNCWGARFTEENLAEAFTVGTDYGLAVIGSTKVGHVRDPRSFHGNLANGMRWGEAYKTWFNEEGEGSDQWHLGLVIMGDPLLTVPGKSLPPDPEKVFDD